MKLIYPHKFKVKNRLITSKTYVKFGAMSGTLFFHKKATTLITSNIYLRPPKGVDFKQIPRQTRKGGLRND